MNICVTIGGREHCYEIPVIMFPIGPHRPGPGPINFPQAIREATILASVQAAADSVSDAGVRGALQNGINAALEALQKRAGAHVKFENTVAAPK
jgi:hypothetical protein